MENFSKILFFENFQKSKNFCCFLDRFFAQKSGEIQFSYCNIICTTKRTIFFNLKLIFGGVRDFFQKIADTLILPSVQPCRLIQHFSDTNFD